MLKGFCTIASRITPRSMSRITSGELSKATRATSPCLPGLDQGAGGAEGSGQIKSRYTRELRLPREDLPRLPVGDRVRPRSCSSSPRVGPVGERVAEPRLAADRRGAPLHVAHHGYARLRSPGPGPGGRAGGRRRTSAPASKLWSALASASSDSRKESTQTTLMPRAFASRTGSTRRWISAAASTIAAGPLGYRVAEDPVCSST